MRRMMNREVVSTPGLARTVTGLCESGRNCGATTPQAVDATHSASKRPAKIVGIRLPYAAAGLEPEQHLVWKLPQIACLVILCGTIGCSSGTESGSQTAESTSAANDGNNDWTSAPQDVADAESQPSAGSEPVEPGIDGNMESEKHSRIVSSESDGHAEPVTGDPPVDKARDAQAAAIAFRKEELNRWAQTAKGALTQSNDKFELVFPHRIPWTAEEFRKLSDQPQLETLQFAGWHPDVSIAGIDLTDEHLLQLRDLPSLRSVAFKGNGITDRSMSRLATFPLETLYLSNTRITDEGLSYFSRHKLRILDLPDTRAVGDYGISKLDLSAIEVFAVTGSRVTDKVLSLLEQSPRVRQLHIARTQIRGHGLQVFRDRNNLTQLYIADLPVTDDQIALFANHTRLDQVNVSGTKVTSEGIQLLANSLPNLRVFRMSGLNLNERQVIDWSRLQGMRELNFWGNRVGDRHLQSFAVMKGLSKLTISTEPKHVAFTRDGLLAFGKALPHCKINNMTTSELVRELSLR